MDRPSSILRAATLLLLVIGARLPAPAHPDVQWVEDWDLGSQMPVGQVVFGNRLVGTTARVHDEGILAWDGTRTERLAVSPVLLTVPRLFTAQNYLWLAGQSALYRLELGPHTGTFYPGETLTQSGTGASADFVLREDSRIVVRPRAGTFAPGTRVRGARSEVETVLLAAGPVENATVLTRTQPAVRCAIVGRTGSPRLGERVRQARTEAEGEVIDFGFEDTHILWLRPTRGRFATAANNPGAYEISCLESGARITASTVEERASRFLPVKVFAGQAFKRQLVDCGPVGPAGRPLLLWPDSPVPNGQTGILWASLDRGDTWTNLLAWRAGAVRHFHGGTFIRGTPETPDRLVLYAGDSDDESGLLVCDDVADLVENPALWRDRWALDLAGASRRAALERPAARPYCFGSGQRYRVLDVAATADRRVAYWIPDAFDSRNQVLMRCDLVTGRSDSTDQRVVGPGAQATLLANGLIVFNTMSEWDSVGRRYGGDEYLRAWLLDPDESLTEIFRRRRVDWRNPSSLAYTAPPVEFTPPGQPPALWFEAWPAREWPTLAEGPNPVGRLLPADTAPTRPAGLSIPPANLLENGLFLPEPTAEWKPTACTATSDATVVDSTTQGLRSLLLAPGGSGRAQVTQTLSGAALDSCRGHWVTLTVRVLADMAPTNGQSAAIAIADRSQAIFDNGGKGSTNWQTWELQHWVAPDADSLRIELTARQSGTATRPVRFANARLLRGAVKGVYPDRLPVGAMRCDGDLVYSLDLFGMGLRTSGEPTPPGERYTADQQLRLWEVHEGRLFGIRNRDGNGELLLYQLPGNPRLLPGFRASSPVPGLAEALTARGRYAYVTTADRRLLVYDTGAGAGDSLALVHTLPLATVLPSELATSNDRLLVVDRLRDVTVLQLANPALPSNPFRLPVEGGALDVAGDNGLVGILTGRRRVEVYDLATRSRRLVIPVDRATPRLRLKNGRLAVGTAPDRIAFWNLSDPMLAAIEGIITTAGAVADFDLDRKGLNTLLADGTLQSLPPPRFLIDTDPVSRAVTLQWQGDLAVERSGTAATPGWQTLPLADSALRHLTNGIRRLTLPADGAMGCFRLRLP